MLTTIITIQAKPGREAEFETLVNSMVVATAQKEPGAVFYRAFKTGVLGQYVMIECFESDAALEAHREMPHFKAARPRLGELWEGAPSIQRLTELSV